MNSVLQWLLNTQGFLQHVEDIYDPSSETQIEGSVTPVIKQLLSFIQSVQNNSFTIVELRKIYQTICDKLKDFTLYEQWDASELLIELIDQLEKSFEKLDSSIFNSHGIYKDFYSKIKEEAKWPNCIPSIPKVLSEVMINLPVSTRKQELLIVKINQSCKSTSKCYEEHKVFCEMDAHVDEIKQKLEFDEKWNFYVVNQDCSLTE